MTSDRTPHTSRPDNSTQTKVWIDNDLLAWLDAEAEAQERSRSFLVNKAIERRRAELQRRRKQAR